MAYQVQLDTGRSATYGGTYDDITAYVKQADWQVGMADSYDSVARPARLSLTLADVNGDFSQDTLGAELLTNGNFATWAGGNPSSWTVTGEVTTDPEVSQVGASLGHGGGGTGLCNLYTTSAALSISQTVLTVGTRYKATLTVDSLRGTGGVVVKCGTTAVSPVYHVAGAKTVYFTAGATSLVIAADGAADVTVDNVSVKATARYTGAINRGTLVRLREGTTTLFVGKISGVEPAAGAYSDRTLRLVVEDAMLALLDAEYQPALLENQTVDIALKAIFDNAVIAYPYAHQYWVLETEGCSELGTTTTLYTHSALNAETGSQSFSLLGDNAEQGKGVSAQQWIRDLVEAEFGGRFWWNPRQGRFEFESRHSDVLDTTVDATFTTADFDQVEPAFGDDLANRVVVDYEPRQSGAAGTVLWTSTETPFHLDRGVPKTFTAKYVAVGNPQQSVGAKDVLALAPGVDVIANTASDGSGGNRSSRIGASIEAGGGSAKITIWTNLSGYYITKVQLRGTPIVRYPREQAEAQDGGSIRDTDKVTKTFSVPVVNDSEYAEGAAAWMVGRLKTPQARLRTVTLAVDNKSTLLTHALNRGVGDRITITDNWTGHNRDYFIVGEIHSLIAGGDEVHRATWVLKPASREQYWLLGTAGYSELGVTTVLAF